MICTVCSSQNEDSAETCFTCGQPLAAAITRGTVIAQRYEILSPLGRGGMGVVYKAHDRVLDETVALKVLRADIAQDPDMARRFRTEIRLARRVRHKNVCGIHEYGEDGRVHYIAMEFIEGIDLKKVLKQTRVGMRTEEAFEVAIQVAEGLQAIHDAGIIHRDLKTPNIMRDAKGHVRLMDFGIAKEEGAASGQTATGLIVGTPEYMSPEQARGEKVDSRTDIYALGIVIFEIFTGEVPFHGETPLATIMKHLKDPPPVDVMNAHHLPAEVRDILLRSLAKDQKERYPTSAAVAEALRQALVRIRGESAATAPGPAHEEWGEGAGDVPTTAMRTPTPLPKPTPTPLSGVRPLVTPRPTRPPTPRPTSVSGTSRPYKTRRTSGWIFALPVVALAVIVGGVLAVWPRDPAATPGTTPSARPSGAGTVTFGTPDPSLPPSLAAASPSAPPSASTATMPAVQSPTPLPSVRPTAAATPVPAPTPVPTSTPPSTTSTTLATLAVVRSTPTPPPIPARGELLVVVSPWAHVAVDGQELGTSPVRAPLDIGKHDIVLTHPEYQPVRRRVTITAGKVSRLDVDLTQDAVPKPR